MRLQSHPLALAMSSSSRTLHQHYRRWSKTHLANQVDHVPWPTCIDDLEKDEQLYELLLLLASGMAKTDSEENYRPQHSHTYSGLHDHLLHY